MNQDQSQDTNQVNQDPSTNDLELLASVKEQAMSALAKLLPNITDIDPAQKFDISINALRSTDRIDLVRPTLQAALDIQDNQQQANSLLELVSEINYLIDSKKPQA